MTFLRNYLKKNIEHSSAVIAYLASLDHLKNTDPTIADAIICELKDQRSYMKLIASENYSSLAVQLAMGNLLTDKYAEGHPRHRFYAGCDNVDTIEESAANSAKKLFSAEYAYVQPHSGADANLVAFFSILVQKVQSKEIEKLEKKSVDALSAEEYEKIRQLFCNQKMMGLSLNSGGHLTHGYRHHVSSKFMKSIPYEVDPETGLLDYENIRAIAKKERPLILVAGYSAYPRKIDFAKMKEIADEVSAVLVCDMAHFAGLVAGGVFEGNFNPIPFADIVTSTTHKTLRGPRGGLVLAKNEFKDTIDKGCPLILGGPLPHVLAAKAIAFKEALSDDFKKYAKKIVSNSQKLAESLLKQGIKLVTGGTDNHLLIIDLSPFLITGRQAENALREAHITANRNAIPQDPNGPWYTSGIRLGTPAMTTLGMGEEEMNEIGNIIATILKHTKKIEESKAHYTIDKTIVDHCKKRVEHLLAKYPLYPEIEL